VEQLDVHVLEGFPESRVDGVIHLGQLQELGVHGRDELEGRR
jgi:hypothetical protein